MPDMPQSQSINLNGLDINYYEWGQKNIPVLICLHSPTNTDVSWREFAELHRENTMSLRLTKEDMGKVSGPQTGMPEINL